LAVDFEASCQTVLLLHFGVIKGHCPSGRLVSHYNSPSSRTGIDPCAGAHRKLLARDNLKLGKIHCRLVVRVVHLLTDRQLSGGTLVFRRLTQLLTLQLGLRLLLLGGELCLLRLHLLPELLLLDLQTLLIRLRPLLESLLLNPHVHLSDLHAVVRRHRGLGLELLGSFINLRKLLRELAKLLLDELLNLHDHLRLLLRLFLDQVLILRPINSLM